MWGDDRRAWVGGKDGLGAAERGECQDAGGRVAWTLADGAHPWRVSAVDRLRCVDLVVVGGFVADGEDGEEVFDK
jgi:hypothetical protein